MELEALLPLLAAGSFGAVCWLCAIVVAHAWGGQAMSEDNAWRRLVLPARAGLAAIAFCAGWAAQEPDPSDERASAVLIVAACAVTFVVCRAAWRAALALRFEPGDIVVGTVGLARPRVLVAPRFVRAASAEALAAALEHERVHVRRRDPLRMWLGRIAADLQWPLPTRKRHAAWLLSIEVRCDDEAVRAGTSPLALAEALLAAARLQQGYPPAVAGVAGEPSHLEARVRRLLCEAPARHVPASSAAPWIGALASLAVLALAASAGMAWGDDLLGALPGLRG